MKVLYPSCNSPRRTKMVDTLHLSPLPAWCCSPVRYRRFQFLKCKPYVYPLVTSLTIIYIDTSSGRRPSMMPDIFAPLTQLESLTLCGTCTIKSMSNDTLASLGCLSESSIGCLTTVRLERLGRRMSPKKFPPFPSF